MARGEDSKILRARAGFIPESSPVLGVDKETRRGGDKEITGRLRRRILSLSPCLLVSLSPCLPFSLSSPAIVAQSGRYIWGRRVSAAGAAAARDTANSRSAGRLRCSRLRRGHSEVERMP